MAGQRKVSFEVFDRLPKLINMKLFVFIGLFAAFTAVNAGYIAGPSTKILQGPSSKTTIVGPEGSVISAVAPGGQIVTEEHPGVVAHSAPVLAAAPAYAAAAYGAPLAAYGAPIPAASHSLSHSVAVAAPALSHSAYAVPGLTAYHSGNTLVAGPSGTITTSGLGYHSPLAYGHAW